MRYLKEIFIKYIKEINIYKKTIQRSFKFIYIFNYKYEINSSVAY